METGKSIWKFAVHITSNISHKDRVFYTNDFSLGRLCYMSMSLIINITNLNISRKKNPSFFVRPLLGWCSDAYVKPTQQKGTKSSQINPEMSQNLSPSAFWRHLAPFPSPDHAILDTPTTLCFFFWAFFLLFVRWLFVAGTYVVR